MHKSLLTKIIKSEGVGTLYMEGQPGSAKTAILQSIANEQNLLYIDLRTSTKDESEIAGIPSLAVDKQSFHYALPEWVLRAANAVNMINEKTGEKYSGCLVVFEELNRATAPVRDACLQVLLEKRVGENFELPDTVYLAATGNLGEEDNTDVAEFDDALNNRLTFVTHDLTLKTWCEDFANANVHPMVIEFLNAQPSYFFKRGDLSVKSFATPRSWTMLSNFITANYGLKSSSIEWINDITEVGYGMVGASLKTFVRYVEDSLVINIEDIINKYPQIKDKVKELNRARKSEIFSNLSAMKFKDFDQKQLNNIGDFMECVSDEEIIPLLEKVLLDEVDNKDHDAPVYKFLKRFNPIFVRNYNYTEDAKKV